MNTEKRFAVQDLARTLTILLSNQGIADLMNATLSSECDERLSGYQCDLATELFDTLCDERPDCVAIAQGIGDLTVGEYTTVLTETTTDERWGQYE